MANDKTEGKLNLRRKDCEEIEPHKKRLRGKLNIRRKDCGEIEPHKKRLRGKLNLRTERLQGD